MGARSYAYREDISVHDAVIQLSSILRQRKRLFVAEYDFAKYFDNISHEHLDRILNSNSFFLSDFERRIIWSFLRSKSASVSDYRRGIFTTRDRGIPQGTSISLFLANIAASELDSRLEEMPIGYVRYADDTVIWASSYDDICRAVDVLSSLSQKMGVDINFNKSDGISLISADEKNPEIVRKEAIDFVGYRIAPNSTSIKKRSAEKIRAHISYLAYSNLLQPINNRHIVPARFAPPHDRDYQIAVFQIRRYMYGGLTESQLRRYLTADFPLMKFHGLMAFYPILSDRAQLESLDGWLLSMLHRLLKKRSRLLRLAGHATLPTPHDLPADRLIGLVSRTSSGDWVDLRLPSFHRMSRFLNRAVEHHGATRISHPWSSGYMGKSDEYLWSPSYG